MQRMKARKTSAGYVGCTIQTLVHTRTNAELYPWGGTPLLYLLANATRELEIPRPRLLLFFDQRAVLDANDTCQHIHALWGGTPGAWSISTTTFGMEEVAQELLRSHSKNGHLNVVDCGGGSRRRHGTRMRIKVADEFWCAARVFVVCVCTCLIQTLVQMAEVRTS
jgi:hypothetical protein